jgi:hypothetical protein
MHARMNVAAHDLAAARPVNIRHGHTLESDGARIGPHVREPRPRLSSGHPLVNVLIGHQV